MAGRTKLAFQQSRSVRIYPRVKKSGQSFLFSKAVEARYKESDFDRHNTSLSLHQETIAKSFNKGSDFDRHKKFLILNQESIAKVNQTHWKQTKILLRNQSVALNFSFSSQPRWSIWSFLVEWPYKCARAAKQKRAYCSLWEEANGTRFYGFCTTSDPRSGHWPQIDENREILFGGPYKKVLQLVTPDNKYVFSLLI